MRKLILMYSLIISFLLISCNSNQKTDNNQQNESVIKSEINDDSKEIPFSIAEHYFVKNNYDKTGVLKITTQEEFDEIFRAAAVMGKDGLPTKIDFSSSYIIAVIGETSNKEPKIKINDLKQNGDSLFLDYSITENKEVSYTTKPTEILILDNKYQGIIKSDKKITQLTE